MNQRVQPSDLHASYFVEGFNDDGHPNFSNTDAPLLALMLIYPGEQPQPLSPHWKPTLAATQIDVKEWVKKFGQQPRFQQFINALGLNYGTATVKSVQESALSSALAQGRIAVYSIPVAPDMGGKEAPPSPATPYSAKNETSNKKSSSGSTNPSGNSNTAMGNSGSTNAGSQPNEDQVTNDAPQTEEGTAQPAPINDICESDPVSMSTGEEIYSIIDFEIPGPLPLVWNRTYRSSQSDKLTSLGYGWSHPFAQYLELSKGQVIYIDQNQRRIRFPLPQSGRSSIHVGERLRLSWIDASGLKLMLPNETLVEFKFPGTINQWNKAKATINAGGSLRIYPSSMTASNGGQWKAQYNSRHELTSLQSNFGRVVNLEYKLGLLSRIHQGQYTWAKYEYDRDKNLTSAYDSSGGAERYSYKNHMFKTRRNKSGYKFTFDWDQWNPRGRCIHQWGEDGSYDYRFQYDPDNKVSYSRDGRGVRQEYYYDDYGRIIKHIDGEGGAHRKVFDNWGNLVKEIDPNGGITRFDYDEYGFVSKRVDPEGNETRWNRRAFKLQKFTNALGESWHYHHHVSGRLGSIEDPNGQVNYFEYDQQGHVTRHNTYAKDPTDLQWNEQGLLTAETYQGQTTQYRYDARANLIAIVFPNGQQLHYRYDLGNRIIAIHQVDKDQLTPKLTHEFSYDNAGRLIESIDANGDKTQYKYGGLSQVEEKINPDGTVISYRYDEERNLTALINENGEDYQLFYDNNERLVKEVGFDGREQNYEYDRNGNLIRHLDGKREILFQRDANGKLLKKVARKWSTAIGQGEITAEEITEFSYDPLGRLTQANNSARDLKWQYQRTPSGKKNHFHNEMFNTQITEWQDDQPLVHQLDGQGRIINTKLFDDRNIITDYTGFNQVSQIRLDNQILMSGVELDSFGRETQRQLGNGLTSANQFDTQGRIIGQQVYNKEAKPIQTDQFYGRQYTYDARGQLTGFEDLDRGATQYSYDKRSRLKSVEGILKETFAFDPANNILKNDDDNADATTARTIRGNRLTVHEDKKFEYDESGNLIRQRAKKGGQEVTEYYYNADNRLAKVTRNGDTLAKYQYDAFGRRCKKTTAKGHTQFFWHQDNLISEQAPRQDSHKYYLFEPNSHIPFAQLVEDDVYYYHNDHLGTPQDISNGQGEKVWSVGYAAYGNVVAEFVTEVENNLRFQGQYYDAETGLHYNRHRYFDPGVGQFTQQDPIGLLGGLNNYQYAANPVTWVDPLGLTAEKEAPNRPLNAIAASTEDGYIPDEYDVLTDTYIFPNDKHPIQKKMLDKYKDEQFNGHPEWSLFGNDTKVKYLSSEELSAYELKIVNNQLVHAAGPSKGAPFDTFDGGNNWGGTGKAIFVMNPEGKIYASNNYPVGEFHHSSFLSGDRVAAAGKMDVAQGKVLEISNDTGHYQTSQENNKQVLNELRDRGLSDSEINQIQMTDYND